MGNASFVQSDFRGGIWSPLAQGRVADPAYKTALAICLNATISEAGAWARRPGFGYLAHTRMGLFAVLRAFDFSVTQPYQMEFTAGFLRFFAGRALVTTQDVVHVSGVSTDNPAKVSIVETVPAGWANGDFVIFTLNSSPCSAPLLCNRQFQIEDLGTKSFTLRDAITGATIDGSTLTYVAGETLDNVSKVFELVTPYPEPLLQSLRCVTNETTVLLLQGTFQPRVISAGNTPSPFQINTQDFSDGPYLDLNTTTTTLTPSGVSGSVNFTASSTTGINNNAGFKTTDVGRILRFQGGPAQWSIGTTYAKNATVTGSDGNVYTSIAGANVGNDPTTDDGSHWNIAPITVTWTWAKITARTSSTVVVATIMGANLPSATATTAWRLGLYSDTTGWPSVGAYHEGRLWLSGSASNRVDASVSNDYFNFSPTAVDGTVADDNAIAAIGNAVDVNTFFWMLTTADGLVLGSQAGEWLVKASNLDDPISPSSIQMRRVTTFGCANIEPVQAWAKTLFVQRQKREVVEHGLHPWLGKYQGDNIAMLADNVTAPGIEEIRWQQQPALLAWMRMSDGSLTAVSYKNVLLDDNKSYHAWTTDALGSGRLVRSVSTGPSFDGLSDTCYLVTAEIRGSEPDFGIHWVECLMPFFDPAADDCDAFFTDAGAVPCCATLLGTAPNYTALRLYGLTYLNGRTVQPFIGGMDLGDFVVANGFIDIPFTAPFTLAYFQSLSTTNCNVTGTTAGTSISTSGANPNQNSLETFVATGSVNYQASGAPGGYLYTDCQVPYVVGVQNVIAGSNGGIQVFNKDTTGAEVGEADNSTLFGTSGGSPVHVLNNNLASRLHPNGNYYNSIDGTSNRNPVACIRVSDRAMLGITGVANSGFGSTGIYVAALFGMAPVVSGSNNYMVTCGEVSAGNQSEIAIWSANGPLVFLALSYTTTIVATDVIARVCEGQRGRGDFYVLGHTNYGGNATTPISLYEGWVSSTGLRLVRSLAPADIDATWTHTADAQGPGFDQVDGNLLFFVQTLDVVTHTFYLVKVNRLSGAVMWKSALTGAQSCDLTMCTMAGGLQLFDAANHNVINIDLSNGNQTTTAWNQGISHNTQFYDCCAGGIWTVGSYSAGSGPIPTLIGQYFGGHSTVTNRALQIYSAANFCPEITVTDYPFYGSVGFYFDSDGQLLRPDFGIDAGARNGPAFGKLRRIHWFAADLYRSRGISFWADNSTVYPAKLQSPGGTPILAPTLVTDIVSDTISCDYSFKAQIAWRARGGAPCTVTAIGGYLETQDK